MKKYNAPTDLEFVLRKMDDVLNNIQSLENRVKRLEEESFTLEASTTLNPAHIKTLQAMSEQRSMTADEIAKLTNRTRALESTYLNQLLILGLVEKKKIGRRHYYSKKPLDRLIASDNPRKVMILVLASSGEKGEGTLPDGVEKVQETVLRTLSQLKGWKLERLTVA